MTSTNRLKIIRKKKYIIKQFKKDGINFRRELNFYLFFNKLKLNFIPQLLGYSIKSKKLIIQNVGINAKLNHIKENIHIINNYENILKSYGYYHNDIRKKNIIYNENLNRFYLIDFEMAQKKLTDFKKGRGDKQNYIY